MMIYSMFRLLYWHADWWWTFQFTCSVQFFSMKCSLANSLQFWLPKIGVATQTFMSVFYVMRIMAKTIVKNFMEYVLHEICYKISWPWYHYRKMEYWLYATLCNFPFVIHSFLHCSPSLKLYTLLLYTCWHFLVPAWHQDYL